MPTPALLDALAELGEVGTRRQLVARGFTGPYLTAAVRSGAVRRVRQGYYATPDAAAPQLAAVRLGGRLGCLSAARTYGLWSGSDDRVHVTLSVNAARLRVNQRLADRRRAVRQSEGLPTAESLGGVCVGQMGHTQERESKPLTPDRFRLPVVLHWNDLPVERRRKSSAWRIELPNALAEVANCATRPDVRAVFESAVATGQLSLRQAQQLLERCAPAALGEMRLSGASGSGAESHFVEMLVGLGLEFRQQVGFDDVGWVDFVVVGRLIVEVDGYTYHSSYEAFVRDRERDAAMLARGYPTLRFPANLVVDEPDRARALLVAALRGLARS